MTLSLWILVLIILTAFCNAAATTGGKVQTKPDTVTKARMAENYGKMPLSFEPNRGQADKQVKFISRGPGYGLFLTSTEAVLSLQASETAEINHGKTSKSVLPVSARGMSRDAVHSSQDKSATLHMKLVGSNLNPQIKELDELPGKANYFHGKDPKQWRTNIRTYAKAKYEKVYPGIDLVYYGNQRQLEYDFIVAPGIDPRIIRLVFEGAESAVIDERGDLLLHTASGNVRLQKPLIFQEIDGKKRKIKGRYMLHPAKGKSPQQLGFELAAYDKNKILVIDPVLVYSTYLGGSEQDEVKGIAVDGDGNVYVTGWTNSYDFQIANPFQANNSGASCCGWDYEVFITKLNTSGSSIIYSTYLGGPGNDSGYDIAVDNAGNTYITGETQSTDFPVVNPLQLSDSTPISSVNDAFVAKLNASGSTLIFSTYLGGPSFDYGRGIAVDSEGNSYVTGYTNSLEFPTTANAFQTVNGGGIVREDAFVTKINTNGSSMVYSTYLGGSGTDRGNDIAVDNTGTAYITGYTLASDFPITFNAYQKVKSGNSLLADAFVTKVNPSGTDILYSTYIGGSGADYGNGIAINTTGNAYLTGETNSYDFPTTLNSLQKEVGLNGDAFVTKISTNGSTLVYSTYLGGTSPDSGNDIAVDAIGNAFVTGYTTSPDFPTFNSLQSKSIWADAFVCSLNTDGSAFFYSTYLGGSKGRNEGRGIALDDMGNAYVTGTTTASNFPTATPLQGTYNGISDAFIFKISDSPASVDADGDGIPDVFEIAQGFNPNDPNDAGLDKDNDGLTNLEEYQHGTNPGNIDSDGDGYNDGVEVTQGTNPLDSNNFPQPITITQTVPQKNNPNLAPPPDVNLSSGNLTLHNPNDFDIEKPIVVITHGWNLFNTTATPDWMLKMAEAIGAKANIFLWNWQEKAKSQGPSTTCPLPTLDCALIPYVNVQKSGEDLAKALEIALCNRNLPNNECAAGGTPNSGKIHLIGHSLGSGVIIYAAKNLKSYNLDHLTLLDSPFFWKLDGLLNDLKKNSTPNKIFVDNYWSSVVGNPFFMNADVNALLFNVGPKSNPDCPFLGDPHGYAHQWYISSFEDFNNHLLLCDDLPIPSPPPKYGSYWTPERDNSESNRTNAAWLYKSINLNAKWNLSPISPKPITVSSSVEFLADTGISLAQAAKDNIIDYAQKTATTIKVVAVNTYNKASDIENYFVDKANHAVWKLLPYVLNGIFELSLNSSAVLHSDIDIPIDANAMRFSYEFVSADDGGVLEVFLDDSQVYAALSRDYVGQGQQYADWIDVSQFAGKHMKLSYRLSNAIEGRQGVVALDDLIFAHIESAKVNDAAYLTIQAPNGGEVWNEGSKQTFNWTSHNIDSKKSLMIYLSTDNGQNWKKIASAKNIGSKTSKIPKKRNVSKQVLIKICLNQKTPLCDTSDAVFTINKAPVAEAGIRQRVIVGTNVILNGAASYDADNGPVAISYKWFQKRGPLVTLTGADTVTPSFIPSAKGTYVFGLEVNDGSANSKQDNVAISVKAAR